MSSATATPSASAATSTASTKRVELDDILAIIRDRICLRAYAPGDVLREGQLAEEFSVSRTPIREVLQRLSSAGLVEARNGVGTIVTERTLEDVRQIYALRIRIAMLIGDMSPRTVDKQASRKMTALLERAQALAGTMPENISESTTGNISGNMTEGVVEEYWRINHEAHFIIAELIGNEPLREIWDRYYFQSASYWYGVVEQDSALAARSLCRELEDILDAMLRDDVAAIGFIERNYIAYGMERLLSAQPVEA